MRTEQLEGTNTQGSGDPGPVLAPAAAPRVARAPLRPLPSPQVRGNWAWWNRGACGLLPGAGTGSLSSSRSLFFPWRQCAPTPKHETLGMAGETAEGGRVPRTRRKGAAGGWRRWPGSMQRARGAHLGLLTLPLGLLPHAIHLPRGLRELAPQQAPLCFSQRQGLVRQGGGAERGQRSLKGDAAVKRWL